MESIRPAGPSDAKPLADLRLAWADENGSPNDPTFVDRFDAWLTTEADRRLFWMAEVEGRPVGMVNLTIFTRMPYPDGADFKGAWGYLGNLFVVPPHRGRGIGGRLLQACTSYADRQDLARVVLSPSRASVPLYERLGFGPATTLMAR